MSHNIYHQKRLTQKQCEQYEFTIKIGRPENFTECFHRLYLAIIRLAQSTFKAKGGPVFRSNQS